MNRQPLHLSKTTPYRRIERSIRPIFSKRRTPLPEAQRKTGHLCQYVGHIRLNAWASHDPVSYRCIRYVSNAPQGD